MKTEHVIEIEAFYFDKFEKACNFAGFLGVEIRKVEDFTNEYAVIQQMKRITLFCTTMDIFFIGKFAERFDDEETEKAMRFKKSGKVKFPIQLVKLCELLEITPEDIAQSFINDLSLSVHGSSGSDERTMAMEYFLRGHSFQHFEHEEVGEMFYDLDVIRRSWPGNQKEEEYAVSFKAAIKEWYDGWKKVKELNIKKQNQQQHGT